MSDALTAVLGVLEPLDYVVMAAAGIALYVLVDMWVSERRDPVPDTATPATAEE